MTSVVCCAADGHAVAIVRHRATDADATRWYDLAQPCRYLCSSSTLSLRWQLRLARTARLLTWQWRFDPPSEFGGARASEEKLLLPLAAGLHRAAEPFT